MTGDKFMYPRELYSLANDGFIVRRKNDNAITSYCVRGERSSGTNFLDALMASGTDLDIANMGWKHGFYRPTIQPPSMLVLGIIRHWKPWLVSMYRKPWHTSRNMHAKLFPEFIREPWESYMIPEGRFGDARNRLGHVIFSDRDPLSLNRIPNILQLRNMKNSNLFGILNLDCNVVLMKYEWLNENPSRLSNILRGEFNISVKSDFTPINTRFADKYDLFKKVRPENASNFRSDDITDADLNFICGELNARQEGILGYDFF